MSYRISVLILLLCLVAVIAQGQSSTDPTQTVAPQPQSPDQMTAQELEQRGDAFRSQKDFLGAIRYYDYVLKKEPRNAIVWNKAGMAELQLGRYDQAKRRFERAAKLKKDYAEAVNNVGVVYYQRKDFHRAVLQYQKALKIRESASFHSNLGAAYFDQQMFDRAMAEYLRALQLDPEVLERSSATGISAHVSKPEDRAKYAFMMAKLYAQAGDTQHCLNQLRRAMENGYPGLKEAVQKDEAFATVRQDPKFAELMQADVPGITQ